MAYHDDLLSHAIALVLKNAANPEQADLRRAVSAAYYSLFHLLISETVEHWSHTETRGTLARMFEHRAMVMACDQVIKQKASSFIGADPLVVSELKVVAGAFIQLQQKRHTADYDNETYWTETEASDEVVTAANSFRTWHSIKHQKIAQDFLISLLIRRRTP